MILLKKYLRFFLKILLLPFLYLIGFLFLKRQKIVIFNSSDYARYNENTRYLFEYMSKNSNYKAYWVSGTKSIINHLKSKNLRHLSNKEYNIKNLLYSFSAKIIFSPGTGFHNPLGLIRKKTVKICTNHGSGPKLVKTIDNDSIKSFREINLYRQFNYVNFTSTFTRRESGIKEFFLPRENLISFGYPRSDQLFSCNTVKTAKINRSETNHLLGRMLSGHEKIILYTPTWRPYQSPFPLFELKGFSTDEFNAFLESENILLFISIHSMNNFYNIPRSTDHIIFIDFQKNPLFDITAFMMEVDLLLNDYSTTTTDFAILERPQIFVLPDYEKYVEEKGFLENYKSVMPGKEVVSFQALLNTTRTYLKEPDQYLKEFQDKIKIYLNKYYNVDFKNSCKQYTDFVNKLFSETL